MFAIYEKIQHMVNVFENSIVDRWADQEMDYCGVVVSVPDHDTFTGCLGSSI